VANHFGQFGTVLRVLRQHTTTSVAWEKAKPEVPTFPEVAVDIHNNLPVEIAVIGSFSPGEGEAFFRRATKLQEAHATFVDEYNEASSKLANADFSKNDPTTIYTFSVDTRDLVFHRHEGHRAITGITGGGGALMRFSGATPEEADKDPEAFVDKMFIVELPADSMFVLRFHGTVYHQFGPIDPTKPAFIAISVHTNEAGGLSGELLDIVKQGKGSIPLLTEPIHENVASLLDNKSFSQMAVKGNKARKKRTVSATKRYVLRLKKKEEAAAAAAAAAATSSSSAAASTSSSNGSTTEEDDKALGNHLFTPTPITNTIAQLLSTPEVKLRVPVFTLPRLVTSIPDPQDVYHVDFEEAEAIKKVAETKELVLNGHPLHLEIKSA